MTTSAQSSHSLIFSKKDVTQNLLSQKMPLIKRTAKQIRREVLQGLDQELAQALRFALSKPRSWETSHELILALAATECVSQLPYLLELVQGDYRATVLYRSLGLAIVYLQNREKKELAFVYSVLESGNQNLLAGAFLGLNQREILLSHAEIQEFFAAAKQSVYLENFRQVLAPIQLLLSMSYLFEPQDRQEIIQYCQELDSPFFARMIEDVQKRKKFLYL